MWSAVCLMMGFLVATPETPRVETSSIAPIKPASERFAAATDEVPDFRRHVLPLLSRLGCNGRACHGSFQGQGGLRLSLFGYDFDEDLTALTKGESPRVLAKDPAASKMLQKATEAVDHGGGQRMTADGWEHRLLVDWIKAGASGVKPSHHLNKLVIEPALIRFEEAGQTKNVRVTAYWSDGHNEDVTCLCRFQTNNSSFATVDETGKITSAARGDTNVIAFYDNGVAATSVITPVSHPSEATYAAVPAPTRVDELVMERLKLLGILPSRLTRDEEFLRRVSLDIAGTLPTAEEVRAFLKDKDPDKRSKKIDELLSTDAYAAWWATKFCDFTGDAEAEFDAPFQKPIARQWYEWVYKRVKENMPYDELVAGMVLGTGREQGESYASYSQRMTDILGKGQDDAFADRPTLPHFWARKSLRTNEAKALRFAHAFLGIRLECAQCHKHPFDQWTKQEFDEFTAFFQRVNYGVAPDATKEFRALQSETGLAELKGKEQRERLIELVKQGKPIPVREVFVATSDKAGKVVGKKKNPTPSRAITPTLLGGEEVVLSSKEDPRAAVLEWMRRADNPYFATAIVNRVWAHYFGVGIIDPPDDLNLANPPSNEKLLTELTKGFIESGYDMKWLHRTVTNSHAYQRSWEPNETNKLDSRNFSRALLRRLPAEVTFDAVAVATSASSVQHKLITDTKHRAVYLGGVGPSGGPANFALKIFGQSDRKTICDCARDSDPSVSQAIYMQNDRDVNAALDRPDGWVKEVTNKLKPEQPVVSKTNSAVKDPKTGFTLAEINDKITKMERRISSDKLTDAEKKQMNVRLTRLKQAKTSLTPATPKPSPKTENAKVDHAERQRMVEEVYLRTVSRYPTTEERAEATRYLKDSPNLASGLRDLLWVMLNTKEFITNH
ncbi:DUF1549 domain-containing protein [bacterium]|nr:DUF1549 domain-containing protein [bacterium]